MRALAMIVTLSALAAVPAIAPAKDAKKPPAKKPNPAVVASAVFARLDKNKDKMLTLAEFSAGLKDKAAAKTVYDGLQQELDPQSTARKELTIFEFRSGFEKYKKLNGAAAVIQQSQAKGKK
jgi:hypothetical protein